MTAEALAVSPHDAGSSEIDALVKSISIPPRPGVLIDLQREIGAEDPDPSRIAKLVGQDVALTAAVIRCVNSPFYSLSRRAETLEQSIALLGLRPIGTLVTGLVLRNSVRTDGPNLTRFWDVSGKRAYAMSRLVRGLKGIEPDLAQSFGLFCDVGIPLLMQRFPDYAQTLMRANEEPTLSFTAVEHAAHNTDHALIGALMSRSWGLSQTVCVAIRSHHDYAIFEDAKVPASVSRLIAMGLVSELAIQRFARMNASTEWAKGGERAAGALMLSDDDVDDWVDELQEGFAAGAA